MRKLIATFVALAFSTSAFAADPALSPTKTWFAPNQPVQVKLATEGETTLRLTEFTGAPVEPQGEATAAADATVDVTKMYPQVATPGTYLLYAVPKGKEPKDFVGTPLVISVRSDRRVGAPEGAMVTKVVPLQYVQMTTNQGPMTLAFYYDVAPHTTHNFVSLADGGFYDGLNFHRIVKEFVIQGGDPRGDGTGGPGYQIDAEFNDRPHLPGVLSMARSSAEDSAGSQFFVCLDYSKTKALDGAYTAFGRVTSGMEAVNKIAATPTDAQNDRPNEPQVIQKAEVKDVTAAENPYAELQKMLQTK